MKMQNSSSLKLFFWLLFILISCNNKFDYLLKNNLYLKAFKLNSTEIVISSDTNFIYLKNVETNNKISISKYSSNEIVIKQDNINSLVVFTEINKKNKHLVNNISYSSYYLIKINELTYGDTIKVFFQNI